MSAPGANGGNPKDTPAAWARRAAGESTEVPREALDFLGRLPLGRRRGPAGGAVPGEMVLPEDSPEPKLRSMSYGADGLDEQEIGEVAALRPLLGVPDRTVWIDIEGFGNRRVLEEVGESFGIHPLAMADVVHIPQRPKAELYDGRLLVITQMALLTDEGDIDIEQVSLVLGPGWVVSFQDRPGDVFDPVRERIRASRTRIRQQGADYLMYALIDAVIDGYFPVVEALGGVIDALEEEVVEQTSRAALTRIHATRRTLLRLHRVQWRQRDAINGMLRDEALPLGEDVRLYLRDAHDHAFQTLDAIETYRDMVVGLMDLYLSSASHRMNEVMKTLTIVATIFIPLTFLAGVYGMNFEYMPELHWRWAYPVIWLLMVGLGVGLVAWFRRRGWIGDSESD